MKRCKSLPNNKFNFSKPHTYPVCMRLPFNKLPNISYSREEDLVSNRYEIYRLSIWMKIHEDNTNWIWWRRWSRVVFQWLIKVCNICNSLFWISLTFHKYNARQKYYKEFISYLYHFSRKCCIVLIRIENTLFRSLIQHLNNSTSLFFAIVQIWSSSLRFSVAFSFKRGFSLKLKWKCWKYSNTRSTCTRNYTDK